MTKVLLVEDDNNLREIYEARLAAEGYTIVSAPDGEAALALAAKEHPDLVISDVMMPKISGFEMLDILRNTQNLQSVKVIMLTALGQAEDKIRADSLGADRYLVKSQVTLEDIVKAAHDLIDDTAAPTDTPPPTSTAVPATPTVAVTPVPASEDSTASAASAGPSAADSATSVTAQNIAEEEASVQAQIESFINPQQAPAPVPDQTPEAPSPTPAAPTDTPPPTSTAVPATPTVAVTPVPASEDSTASAASGSPQSIEQSDKIIATAVEDLIAGTEQTAAPEPVATAPPVTSAPVPEVVAVTTPTPSIPARPNDSAPIANKKVVLEPLPSPPQPSIHELLAREEAKNAAQQAAGTVVTAASEPAANAGGAKNHSYLSQPATTPQPAQSVSDETPSGAPPDPNSIAL